MSNLELFMVHKNEENELVERVVSQRFKDSEGKPMKFKFKAISPSRDAQLKAECTKKTMVTQGKRKGQMETEFLASKYQNLLTVESIVYPDLNDAKLQDFYGVMGAEAVFDAMLKPGEVLEAFLGAQEANGYEIGFDELVEEAKN